MLKINTNYNKESFPLFDSEQLANIINHDIKNIPFNQMCMATHNYDLMFIESVMKAIVLQADIDRFAKILKTCWKIDVADYRLEVVRLNTKTHQYEPYYPHFEENVDAIVEKIRQTRELRMSLQKQMEEWESSHTQIPIASSETNQTTQPTFNADESVEYHLDDLPKDVKNQIMISNDILYSNFVLTLQGPINLWIGNHHKKDWNVVRFICRLRGIVTRTCSIHIFAKLLELINLGNQENNMKQRQDANKESNLKDYDDPNKKQKFWKLKKDGDDVEEMLKDIIDQLAA